MAECCIATLFSAVLVFNVLRVPRVEGTASEGCGGAGDGAEDPFSATDETHITAVTRPAGGGRRPWTRVAFFFVGNILLSAWARRSRCKLTVLEASREPFWRVGGEERVSAENRLSDATSFPSLTPSWGTTFRWFRFFGVYRSLSRRFELRGGQTRSWPLRRRARRHS